MTDATTLLLKAATQFRYYERNHRAKNTPESLAKAEINADQASEIERYLSGQPDTYVATDLLGAKHAMPGRPTHPQLVATLQKSGEAILATLTPLQADMAHMALGVCGEAGELADAVKKYSFYNKPVDRENVVEEMGDIEFYLEGIRRKLEITREETLEHNIDKLSVRYQGLVYSDQRAIDRADKA